MRSIWRTLDRALARDIALVCAAGAVVGASFGAITVSAGLPLWLPMLLSVLVFAGAAQFMFVGIVASGGNPVAAVVAGLLLNARHLPFGFAIGDVLGGSRARRLVGSHLMIDESVAFALAQEGTERRRSAYWACGVGLFVCWNIGVVAGAFAGTAVNDTDALGLDAAFPAVLLALILPSLRDAATRRAALIGTAIALLSTPFLPAGLPVLMALIGVLVMLLGRDQAGSRLPERAP
ncbi:AzlC family ABC transporter permease [Phytoactinopolyspora halotolerans]|uniref:Branched-chain amino acid ABC transporter permease n=1 Tax=Phytoactinopolyspora halotolerans TaxID=1981512 RepID=A0A6L9S2C3_9ACTN|nr:AzlC family ABC transporter permease [Phytoactinopolyspora halotolerans]NED98783.1 branched-chain amino acid ABC transporter permease [Phytoactinopolyspora halotolerans]